MLWLLIFLKAFYNELLQWPVPSPKNTRGREQKKKYKYIRTIFILSYFWSNFFRSRDYIANLGKTYIYLLSTCKAVLNSLLHYSFKSMHSVNIMLFFFVILNIIYWIFSITSQSFPNSYLNLLLINPLEKYLCFLVKHQYFRIYCYPLNARHYFNIVLSKR